MRHWSKLAVALLVGALALATPLVAGAAKRPPTGTQATPVAGDVLGVPAVAASKQARTAAAGYVFSSANVSAAKAETCSSGAHTLSKFGDRVYPEMGNGGYTSLHSDVTMNYDVPSNQFLPGTKVDLQVVSTQCLTDLSFDFERTNASTPSTTNPGPNMTVNSVEINGAPATFTFKQPTYPGDPNGQDDPDPAAHAISNSNPVSATNPNPPACSPQTSANTQNGLQCPFDKLVITPSVSVPSGTTFTVTINFTGRPGVHVDGDGSTEGWFRVNTTALPNDGAFVTTEPVGTDSWMPLNNHPSAKPSYDFYDTTNVGKTAIGPGSLVGTTPPTGGIAAFAPVSPTSVNPPDANFPDGSWTWHWHEPAGIANYLVENSIGSYDVTARTSATSGIQYFQAVASGLTAARKTAIKASLDTQEDITEFQKLFNGPWPFTTNGVVVAQVSVGFAEEMQTKITFGNGTTSTPSAGTFNHENMHQWFGDNVAEAAFNLTFWKEGWATVGEYLNTARSAATAAGGYGTPAGDAAFEASLVSRFNGTGNYNSTSLWASAPSNPTVGNLFSTASTYTRPGTAYLGMWRVLGKDTMIATMKQIQSQYGNSSITEAQLVDVFRQSLPVKSASCNARLTSYFAQWFDTPYASGGGLNRPQLTGPGLNGPGFPCAAVSPASPDGANGWYKSPVSVTWSGFPTVAATSTATKNGCVDETVSTDGTFDKPCAVVVTTTSTGVKTGDSGSISETFRIDATAPVTAGSVSPEQPNGSNGWYVTDPTITLTPSDPASGIASTQFSIGQGGVFGPYTAPFAVCATAASPCGPRKWIHFYSTDVAGNTEATKSIILDIDLNDPTSTATLDPASPNGAGGWYSTVPTVTLSASDATSGVAAIKYTLDGGALTTYSAPLAPGDGQHHLTYFAVDNAGRQEASKSLDWMVDSTGPTTTATITPASPDGGGNWYLSPPTVTLAVADPTSGATIRYSLDGGPSTTYSGPIKPLTEGFHSLTYAATDAAGNQETPRTMTWAIDLAPPTTTATLTPSIRNGYYADPKLTLTVDDGQGSGNKSLLTGPCKPPYLCDFVIMASIDGGAFKAWEPPEHFGSGNHFVQYYAKDAAGRIEATKIIAFKADSDKPSVTLTTPAEGATYPKGKVVKSAFKCTDKLSGIDTCFGWNGGNPDSCPRCPTGTLLDTSTVGPHTFTVQGVDRAGNVTTVTHHYSVRYVWNGYNRPIKNTESGVLNLVHAGDPIKLGFGLDGNQGLDNVFLPGYPKIIVIPCPPWPLQSIAGAGSGFVPGLSFGLSSGHYTYGWQTSTAYAGTCRRFEIQLNDGSATLHTADFMFFA